MESIQLQVKRGAAQLDDTFSHIDLLNKAAASTGVPRLYIGVAGILFVLAFAFIGFGANFICNAVGFAYPAFMSFKAIETVAKEDDTQWLMYWVCFAALTVGETMGGFLIWLIPFYYPLKLITLIMLFSPQLRGAEFFYLRVLKPFLEQRTHLIDSALDQVTGALSSASNVVKASASRAAAATASEPTVKPAQADRSAAPAPAAAASDASSADSEPESSSAPTGGEAEDSAASYNSRPHED